MKTPSYGSVRGGKIGARQTLEQSTPILPSVEFCGIQNAAARYGADRKFFGG